MHCCYCVLVACLTLVPMVLWAPCIWAHHGLWTHQLVVHAHQHLKSHTEWVKLWAVDYIIATLALRDTADRNYRMYTAYGQSFLPNRTHILMNACTQSASTTNFHYTYVFYMFIKNFKIKIRVFKLIYFILCKSVSAHIYVDAPSTCLMPMEVKTHHILSCLLLWLLQWQTESHKGDGIGLFFPPF